MARTVAIGLQDFGDLIQKKCFYIDKTSFIIEEKQYAALLIEKGIPKEHIRSYGFAF